MEVVADPRTMSPRQPPALSGPVRASFVENLVLTLIAAGPTHGFAVAHVLGREGEIGRIYEVPRPLVYRAVDRLIEGHLVRPLRVEAGDHGPPRTVVTTTAAGQRMVRKWLATPAEHVRDVRTELVVKLALLQRSDKDPTPLLEAQRVALGPIVTALDAQCELTEGLTTRSHCGATRPLWPRCGSSNGCWQNRPCGPGGRRSRGRASPSRPLPSDQLGDEFRPPTSSARRTSGSRSDGVVLLLDRCGGNTILEGDDLVAMLVAGAHGRLNAAVGEEPAEGNGGDSLAAKDEIEVGAGEGVEAPLSFDHDVTIFGGEIVDDPGTPGTLDERLTIHHALEDSVRMGLSSP